MPPPVQCDPDLRVAGTELYLDPKESRGLAVISHAHADHIGRHGHFIATAPTAAFLRSRAGEDLQGTVLEYGAVHQLPRLTVELRPAGHILGSAMTLIRSASHSVCYTGDFKLSPSFTAEPAEIPRTDSVVMESTYGSPEWVFPSREVLQERLLTLARSILSGGRTAVLLAYSLGKSQEAAAMLRQSGMPLVLHPVVASMASIYERHGVELGCYEVWQPQVSLFGARSTNDLRGKIVIIPPHLERDIRRIPQGETVSLTGWALHRQAGADHGLPLSDHADFNELLAFAEGCGAKTIYVTHGSKRFAAELRRRGLHAEFLQRKPQMRLF